MLIMPSRTEPRASEITPREVYERRGEVRRSLLQAALGASLLPAAAWANASEARTKLAGAASPLSTDDKQTSYKDASSYNNFYEFGTQKDDPARNAHSLVTQPWTVRVEGEVAKPGVYDIEKLLKLAPMQERIYRLRCVEGWSMVIPWVGYPMSALIRQVQPTGNAKYVEFTTLADRKQMPGIASQVLDWPYVEGLRMDEAMHELTLLGFGMYGEVLPNQNGAPVRLTVPWKYGFKSGKSIVRIRFVEKQPLTSWNRAAPSEYGFYSNVNPGVPHPRWSQATERRIGQDGFFDRKRKTEIFNGYADQVASLYRGMDLKRQF